MARNVMTVITFVILLTTLINCQDYDDDDYVSDASVYKEHCTQSETRCCSMIKPYENEPEAEQCICCPPKFECTETGSCVGRSMNGRANQVFNPMAVVSGEGRKILEEWERERKKGEL